MRKINTIGILGILSLVLVCGFLTAQQAYGGEPSCPYQITGPKIIGQLTLVNLRDGQGEELLMANVTFRGMCKREIVKTKLCNFLLSEVASFDDITKENLTGYFLLYGGPPDCKSECGGEDIVISKVMTFQKKPDKITANVIFEYVECLEVPTTPTRSKVKSKK